MHINLSSVCVSRACLPCVCTVYNPCLCVLSVQASEERLTLSQEELSANRVQLTGLEGQVQEVKAARASLEQELAKRDQKLGQQETALKDLQKQQVDLIVFVHSTCRPRVLLKSSPVHIIILVMRSRREEIIVSLGGIPFGFV